MSADVTTRHGIAVVAQPGRSPLVTVRLVIRAGSAWDPPGQEGLAALTAALVGDAGTARRSYRARTEALYPLGTGVSVRCDRELASVGGTVHVHRLGAFTELLLEAVLTPGFDEADVLRLRQRQHSHLTSTLRAASDELLGLEALQQAIFGGDHPYGHAPEGTVQSLARLTGADARRFHRATWTRARLVVGVAGGYDEAWLEGLLEALGALPAGEAAAPVPVPAAPVGRSVLLVEKPTASVGIHVGYPLSVGRDHPDFAALWLANSFLGEHRTFHGRLMQQLRGIRGLNYGDYSYAEHHADAPATTQPTPHAVRSRPHFSIWVRPVPPEKALFALRAALHELDRLVVGGLGPDELDATREFLLGYARLWAQTASRRLGFAMDGLLGAGGGAGAGGGEAGAGLVDLLLARLPSLTAAEVTDAVRRHLRSDRWTAVLVCGDAARLEAELRADGPSPISYPAPMPDDVLETDRLISVRRLGVGEIATARADSLFEGR